MSAEITIPSSQLEQLTTITEIEIDRLKAAISAAEAGKWMRPKQLEDGLGVALQSHETSKSLVRTILAWRSLSFQWAEKIEVVVEGVRAGLAKLVGQKSEILGRFDERRELIVALLKSEAVRRVSKVLSLSYEYSHLYKAARILTDVRPIYDEDGSKFSDSVISHTLSLKYDSADREHTLSLALDLNDLKRLRDECDRAITKAKAAKVFMESVNVQTVISGDDNTD